MAVYVHFESSFDTYQLFLNGTGWSTGGGQKRISVGKNPSDALAFLLAQKVSGALPEEKIVCVSGDYVAANGDGHLQNGVYKVGSSTVTIFCRQAPEGLWSADVAFVARSVADFKILASILLDPRITSSMMTRIEAVTKNAALASQLRLVSALMRPYRAP